jgi:hypothetical protein
MSTQSSTAAEPADSPVELADRAVPGWWLNFVAGMVPLLAGLVVLLSVGSVSHALTPNGGPDLERLTFRIRICPRPARMHRLGWKCSARSVASTSSRRPLRSAWLRASDSGMDSAGLGGSLPSVSYESVCTMPS